MKSFTNIILASVCLIVLPFALPAVATAADDNDSDVKLTPQQQKWLDDAPPEKRETLRKKLVEKRKSDLQIRKAMKKITASALTRSQKTLEQASQIDEHYELDLFLRDAEQQEFRDYIGIDKEFAERLKKEQIEMLGKMTGGSTSSTEAMQKIALASTDDEVDKLNDEMTDKSIKAAKAAAAMLKEKLNPQQFKKLKELQMIHSSPNDNEEVRSLFDFGQYELLDLTDEQQKKIAAIKTEYFIAYEPLFKKQLEFWVREFDRALGTPESDNSEAEKKKTEEMEKERVELREPITKLNAATRARILTLFAKEQTAKLEKVLNNAPNYLAERVGLIKKGENNGAWKPNENSWKPGDGPTEEYLERERLNSKPKRDRQFPTKEKE